MNYKFSFRTPSKEGITIKTWNWVKNIMPSLLNYGKLQKKKRYLTVRLTVPYFDPFSPFDYGKSQNAHCTGVGGGSTLAVKWPFFLTTYPSKGHKEETNWFCKSNYLPGLWHVTQKLKHPDTNLRTGYSHKTQQTAAYLDSGLCQVKVCPWLNLPPSSPLGCLTLICLFDI